jgi:hypothetical protein
MKHKISIQEIGSFLLAKQIFIESTPLSAYEKIFGRVDKEKIIREEERVYDPVNSTKFIGRNYYSINEYQQNCTALIQAIDEATSGLIDRILVLDGKHRSQEPWRNLVEDVRNTPKLNSLKNGLASLLHDYPSAIEIDDARINEIKKALPRPHPEFVPIHPVTSIEAAPGTEQGQVVGSNIQVG